MLNRLIYNNLLLISIFIDHHSGVDIGQGAAYCHFDYVCSTVVTVAPAIFGAHCSARADNAIVGKEPHYDGLQRATAAPPVQSSDD